MAKESVYIREELNSHRRGLVQQHDKRKCLHKKRVELSKDWLGTTTWLSFHCFKTPIWLPWRHVHLLYTVISLQTFRIRYSCFETCCLTIGEKLRVFQRVSACYLLPCCLTTLNLNQAKPATYYPQYQSALSRKLLHFCGTTFVETAVFTGWTCSIT